MIKSKIIEVIGLKQDQLSVQDIAASVNGLLDKLTGHLINGGRIEIRGFGSFSLHYRPPRQAHNPKTGEKLVTPPKYAVHFKPGKDLREAIDQSKDRVEIVADNGEDDE